MELGTRNSELGTKIGTSAVPRSAFRVPSYCLLVLVVMSTTLRADDSTEARFLTGLRERRLFELAESYCKQELTEAYASRRRRAELTIELSRTLLESALYAKPPRRNELFAAATQTLDEAKFAGPDDVWRVPVAVQRGMVELVHGELLREEAQALNSPETALAAARERLRGAVAQLRKARDAVEEQLRQANRVGVGPTTKPDEPTAAEWAALKRNVDYQLARAYRNQGESYPLLSADRTAALDQAIKELELLARSEATDAVTWQARLDEVVCRRLQTDLEGAERMLMLIDQQSPPADVAERARAQRIRVRLDAALLNEAKKFIHDDDVDPASRTLPEVRLAVLEWMLDSSQAAAKAGRADDADDWRSRATALARIIADRHSAAWAVRAETIVAAVAAAAPSSDAAQLLKAAESFYQQGNVDRALEVYDRAYATALDAKDTAGAFAAGFTAAAIERSRKRHAEAADRLLQLAAALPDHPRAGEAHLAAVFETAELLRAATDARELLARYRQLLDEHVTRWPADATTPQAYYLLGLLKRSGGDEPGAAAAFAKVVPDGLTDPASPVARGASWGLARLWIETTDDRFADAAKLLEQLRDTATDDREIQSAEAWLVAADVGLQRYDEATRRAAELSAVSADDAAAIAVRLDRLAERRPTNVRPAIAVVILRLLELGRGTAPPTPAEARALALAGRTAEARRVWESVAGRAPRDVALQTEFAEFLSSQTDRDAATAAVAKWREIERASPESSPRWYQARLGLARAYLQLGDKSRAAQMIELTEALHPELGGAAMKSQFDKVRRQSN